MNKIKLTEATPYLGWFSRFYLIGNGEDVKEYINKRYANQPLLLVETDEESTRVYNFPSVWNVEETKCLVAIVSRFAFIQKVDKNKWEATVFSPEEYQEELELMAIGGALNMLAKKEKPQAASEGAPFGGWLPILDLFEKIERKLEKEFKSDAKVRKSRADSPDVWIFEPKFGVIIKNIMATFAQLPRPPPTPEELTEEPKPGDYDLRYFPYAEHMRHCNAFLKRTKEPKEREKLKKEIERAKGRLQEMFEDIKEDSAIFFVHFQKIIRELCLKGENLIWPEHLDRLVVLGAIEKRDAEMLKKRWRNWEFGRIIERQILFK